MAVQQGGGAAFNDRFSQAHVPDRMQRRMQQFADH
jgi:hypothetical protein